MKGGSLRRDESLRDSWGQRGTLLLWQQLVPHSTIGEPWRGIVWTVAMPDGIPWKYAASEKDHMTELRWTGSDPDLTWSCSQALVTWLRFWWSWVTSGGQWAVERRGLLGWSNTSLFPGNFPHTFLKISRYFSVNYQDIYRKAQHSLVKVLAASYYSKTSRERKKSPWVDVGVHQFPRMTDQTSSAAVCYSSDRWLGNDVCDDDGCLCCWFFKPQWKILSFVTCTDDDEQIKVTHQTEQIQVQTHFYPMSTDWTWKVTTLGGTFSVRS